MIIGKHLCDVMIIFHTEISSNRLGCCSSGEGIIYCTRDAIMECWISAFPWCHWGITYVMWFKQLDQTTQLPPSQCIVECGILQEVIWEMYSGEARTQERKGIALPLCFIFKQNYTHFIPNCCGSPPMVAMSTMEDTNNPNNPKLMDKNHFVVQCVSSNQESQRGEQLCFRDPN